MARPIESPCTGVCRMDRSIRLCAGCFRTLDEIEGWARFSNGRRRRVIDQIGGRKAKRPKV